MKLAFMKKSILFLLVLAAIAACGVKSDLDRPSGGAFPRDYPVD